LQANLASDDFLQRERDARRDISDENDGTAFADGVDGGGDGFISADGFESDVDTLAVGEFEKSCVELVIRNENFGGTKLTCELQARGVDVGDENTRAASDPTGLQNQDADGARTKNQGGGAGGSWREGYGMKSDGYGFEHGSFRKGQILWETMKNARGNCYIFGESSGAAVIAARNAENLACVAEIDITA
jgi:hypothetical protein